MVSDQVLYRKWRPQRFGDVVGQNHVGKTLRRAVSEGRIAHAYLFCGPRGTGKTSTARILAKALNCVNSSEGEPDGTCENCVAFGEGRMIDLIEIDAASNRGINDIRDLQDKVKFSPSSGRFKVYIIDEAHMLTDPASNAFLKTLEEPPPHAIFILATTEVQELKPTIVSRCQRYNFRRIANDDVIKRLVDIATSEGFEIEPDVFVTIARTAWGSLRDAANILEQLAISFNGKVTDEQARELLGIGDIASGLRLAVSVLNSETTEALEAVNEYAETGADLRMFHVSTVEALRAALLLKIGVKDALNNPDEVVLEMGKVSSNISMEKLLYSLKVFSEVKLGQNAASPLPLELAVVDAVSGPQFTGISQSPKPTVVRHEPVPNPAVQVGRKNFPAVASTDPPPSRARIVSQSPEVVRVQSRSSPDQRWDGLVKTLSRVKGRRFMLGALLRGSSGHEVINDELIVRFQHRSHFDRIQLELDDPVGRRSVENAVAEAYNTKTIMRAVHDNSESNLNGVGTSAIDSPLVRAVMTMGGRIIGEESRDGGYQ